MREYEDAMLEVQERYERMHDESTMELKFCSKISLSKVLIYHKVSQSVSM